MNIYVSWGLGKLAVWETFYGSSVDIGNVTGKLAVVSSRQA